MFDAQRSRPADASQTPALEEVNSPVRAPTVHSDVLVPMFQALVSGLFVALGVGAAIKIIFNVRWDIVGLLATLLFSFVGVAVWFWRMGWAASTIDKLEQRSGVDLNGDGFVPPHAYSVNRTQQPKRDPISYEKARLNEFVNYCYQHGTSIRTLRTRFADAEISRFQAILLRSDIGVAQWLNPRSHTQGWRLVVTHEEALDIVGRLGWSTAKGNEI